MNDQQLTDLFATGTTPEHDTAFALQVAVAISQTRLRMRLQALAWRLVAMLLFLSTLFLSVRAIKPLLAQWLAVLPSLMGLPMQLLDAVPSFMGVPLPLVLVALTLGLLLHPHLQLRISGKDHLQSSMPSM